MLKCVRNGQCVLMEACQYVGSYVVITPSIYNGRKRPVDVTSCGRSNAFVMVTIF